METSTQTQVDPSKIMQVGTGFMATKTLLTAVNMELFTILSKRELSGKDIQSRLGLHNRNLYDFLDALVALGFLKRTGIKETSLYKNAPDSDMFLDKNKPSYVGGILEMCNNRLYPFWNDLEDGLKTGLPQNETKNGGEPIFEAVYADPKKLREFVSAMGGVQMGNFIAFAKQFDFSPYKTLCDIGGAGGALSAQVATNHKHVQCTTFDLAPVSPIAKENLNAMGLGEKVKVVSGDFFTDNFPKADIITMGQILHDWGTKDKKMLIQKAYDALPKGGALVIIENIIDDNRSENAFGLLMSLNMLIETTEGYDFTVSDFNKLAKEAGFTKMNIMPLTGPSSAAIAIK
ncbi:methyltransferase [Kriegella aquimaris]|uniref:Dimerisation domain-containing protein n=1 Tax=Kriegella aquimaris TaxID=192904 RepID=A0A1G9NU97_9FLAO|nr:methyltransferase [Kriegella aquimaris]SDL90166.1 Dimerisation domain-containing protein [Kriegella aquimaris]